MLQALQRINQIPELRSKIVFTLLMLIVYRIGGFIPVPGINGEVAVGYFRQLTGGGQNLFQMVDMFSGGAFSQMTVIALGVVPYISASIIMQLFVALWPSLQREVRENPDPRQAKNQQAYQTNDHRIGHHPIYPVRKIRNRHEPFTSRYSF